MELQSSTSYTAMNKYDFKKSFLRCVVSIISAAKFTPLCAAFQRNRKYFYLFDSKVEVFPFL
jgi:hypothetical protein